MKHAVLALFLGGCLAGPPPGEESLPPADFDRFVRTVQPIFEARCANPSCHGSDARPLEIYAVHQHRLDPRNAYLDAPLTHEELWANYRRAWGFLLGLDDPDDSLLLQKPLAGGVEHGGGVLWSGPEEMEYVAVREWCTTREAP